MRIDSPSLAVQLAITGGLLLILYFAALIFWPALNGPFLFDDLEHLPALGDDGGITSAADLLRLAFSSDSGPLKRPLAMMSFALDDQNWPAPAWHFKYTNLMLHLLNGVLVFVLLRRLGNMVTESSSADWLALGVMAIWLLHPIQITTMMQVVQRMTLLMALFTLVGLIAYLHGRQQVTERSLRGYAWMTLGIGMLGPLAVLSKENGILICLYALVIEVTLIRRAGWSRPRGGFWWQVVFLILPLLALAWYLLRPVVERLLAGTLDMPYPGRDFNLLERLLTEARILFDYLGQFLLPRLGGGGLFHDDYTISHGLLDPPLTLVCVLLIVAALLFALSARRTSPVISFAILWFLGGHALESTVIGLELYFEHRNYLPMLGPLFAMGYGLAQLQSRLHRLLPVGVLAYLGLLVLISYHNSTLWGNEFLLSQTWAAENPTSARAQGLAARYWIAAGDIDRALEHARLAVGHNPDETTAHVDVFMFRCLQGKATQAEAMALVQAFRTGKHSHIVLDQFASLRRNFLGRCPGLDTEILRRLITALEHNPAFAGSQRRIAYEKGKLGIVMNDLNYAQEGFDKAFAAGADVDIALAQALVSAARDKHELALKHLKNARAVANTGWQAWIVDRTLEIQSVENLVRAASTANLPIRLDPEQWR